jgi:hypothetical protein
VRELPTGVYGVPEVDAVRLCTRADHALVVCANPSIAKHQKATRVLGDATLVRDEQNGDAGYRTAEFFA